MGRNCSWPHRSDRALPIPRYMISKMTRHTFYVILVVSSLSAVTSAFLVSSRSLVVHQRQRQEGRIFHAKRGGKGGGKSGARSKVNVPDRLVEETEYVEIQQDGSDSWRCSDITDLLRRGGVGCLPTDTGYGFVTPIDSKAGLERILKMKGYLGCKKPLSLLCSDLATIDQYAYGIDKQVFKVLKGNLPGPYTFILPASSNLPKMMFLDNKGGKHSWARKSIGVRMPNDPVLKYVQEELGKMGKMVYIVVCFW